MRLPRPSSIFEWAVIGLILFAVFLGGKTIWNAFHDDKQSNEGAVMAERVRTDSIKIHGDSIALAAKDSQLTLALKNGTRVVDKWNTVKVPVYLPASASAHDTIASVTKRLSACYQAGDSLVESVVKIQSACGAFRDTAKKTIADMKTAYSHLDSLYKIGKPPKRWGIGPFIGYGIRQDSSWAIKRGFTVGVGLSYHIISF